MAKIKTTQASLYVIPWWFC